MDYYLKTTSKEEFIQDLNRVGIEIELTGDYYQDDIIIIDWIGLIPNPVQLDENGEIIGEITYRDGLHVNIRHISTIDVSMFINTTEVYPQVPYRVFS
jgi:hypothetical protein